MGILPYTEAGYYETKLLIRRLSTLPMPICMLVYRLAYNGDVAAGQLAVFQGASEAPYLSHTGRASNAEKQPTGRGPEGCVENGPAARYSSVTYRFRYAPSSRLADGPF